MLKSHWKFKIDYVNFPKTNRKFAGVYMIDNVYIGASKHNRGRIISHCNAALRNEHGNLGLNNYLNKKITNNETIIIRHIDSDIYKEGNYIRFFNPVFNLTFNSYTNKK